MILGIDASRANRAQKTGVEGYAYHLIQALKEVIPSEHQVLLYTDRQLEGPLGKLPRGWESRVLRAVFGRLWTVTSLTLEMLFNPPDLLFVPAGALPLILPKKSVTTIHDVTFLSHADWYGWQDERMQKIALSRAREASAMIAPSDFTKDEMIHHAHFSPDKIHVVPLAPDPGYHPGLADPSVLSRYGIQDPYVIFVGRLDVKKNLDTLIKAHSNVLQNTRMKKLQLVLVGAPGFGWKKILKTISESSHRSCVKVLGWVPQTDLQALMRGTRALVNPAPGEGFGLPVLEAMASGVPAVAARAGALPEACGGAAHLAHPFDAEVWASALGELLDRNHESYRAHLVASGLARAAEFSWERTARETWGVLSHA